MKIRKLLTLLIPLYTLATQAKTNMFDGSSDSTVKKLHSYKPIFIS